MKRIFCIFLAVILSLSCCVCAFAADSSAQVFDKADQSFPFILIRGMDLQGVYVDVGTENQRPAMGEITVGGVMGTLAKATAKGVIDGSIDSALCTVLDYVRSIFEYYSFDCNGQPVYNTGMKEYPLSMDNYTDFDDGESKNEEGIIRTAKENYGGKYVYYINYDWRLNPLEVADTINEYVERACNETGSQKVNIICASMGGVMAVAYLSKYSCDRVNKCVFMSSTFYGTYVTSDLLQGNIRVGSTELRNFAYTYLGENKYLTPVLKILDITKAWNCVAGFANKFLNRYKDMVYDKVLRDVFGNMPSLWALVLPEDYEACKEFMFGGKENEYAGIIKIADELQNMMANRDDMLKAAVADGMKICIVANYGRQVIPIYERSSQNGDGTLETQLVSGGAIVAPIGETLGDDYVCSNPEYLSPSREIDASTCLFPEYTWFVKGAPHVSGNYGSDYSDFIFWLVDYDGQPTVRSNAKYPQFMQSASDQHIDFE
ncbi:MAG: esterase/lipase family protein [Acutalibacteraceae bacterium]